MKKATMPVPTNIAAVLYNFAGYLASNVDPRGPINWAEHVGRFCEQKGLGLPTWEDVEVELEDETP